ncbi:Protein SDA1-like protein [Smittium mucronatum]|uniref:Protein SDA1 n=1 Tax=Smittium mucronatum TaxID=133383 RepID=A0A1R0H8N9_9FUNG|nr:Protein SDA1-like protein [Smittium mucronatum]
MGRRGRATEILNNLPQLQNLMKRDPPSYRDEFLQQWRHFESSMTIFELKPEDEYKDFSELLMFLSHYLILILSIPFIGYSTLPKRFIWVS